MTRVRVWLSESAGLHRGLVERLRRAGFPGATVWKGTLGFGAGGRLHSAAMIEVEGDLPVVVEAVVDDEAAVLALLADLPADVPVTLEPG